MLTAEQKKEIMTTYAVHPGDTGSPDCYAFQENCSSDRTSEVPQEGSSFPSWPAQDGWPS